MSEMVERVAKAIDRVSTAMNPHRTDQELLEAAARAAIEAMREPTDEMLASLKEDWWDNETPLTVWQAMIDGALAKPAA